jgi:hypothetical protein
MPQAHVQWTAVSARMPDVCFPTCLPPRSRRWLLGKAMPLTCRCAESTPPPPPPPKNARASSGERRNLVIGTPYSAHQVAFSGKARIGAGPEGRDPRDGKRETHGRGRGRLPPPETVDRAGTTQIVCSRPPKDERMHRRAPAQGTAPSDGVPEGGEARGRTQCRGPRLHARWTAQGRLDGHSLSAWARRVRLPVRHHRLRDWRGPRPRGVGLHGGAAHAGHTRPTQRRQSASRRLVTQRPGSPLHGTLPPRKARWEPTSRCRGRRAAGTRPHGVVLGAGWEASRRYERPDA